MNHLHLPEVDSTNAWLRANSLNHTHGFVVSTDFQTSGKGQAENVWESERNSNVLFSLLLEPTKIPVQGQFLLSQLVSIAIVKVLQNSLKQEVRIKWPNDIYVGDKKVAGILIENSIVGEHITKAIVGVGINVNQTAFTSQAPNPISMKQLAGKSFSCEQLLQEVITTILNDYEAFLVTQFQTIQQIYFSQLYRNSGFHSFKTKDSIFEAEIDSILPTGPLCLRTKKDEYKIFAFKEVQFVH